MLSETEKTLLQELLLMAPVPEQTFSFHELMGYMFGLAISPVAIPEEEWMSHIFGDDPSGISAKDQARSMATVLRQVFSTFVAKEGAGTLEFPYDLEVLEHTDLLEVIEWVSGFEEALSLRPELWSPEDRGGMEEIQYEELFYSLMVIQALIDPEEMLEFFEKLPDEILAEAFVGYDPEEHDRQQQILGYLLATLPLAIRTLRQYGQMVAAHNPSQLQRPIDVNTAPKAGKKTPAPKAKDNIIEVDFGARKKKKKPAAEHFIYQLKISLQRAKPPIWRRVLVPDTITLGDLHLIIQVTMGWLDGHLHQFEIGNRLYSFIDDEVNDMLGMETTLDEDAYTLHDLAPTLEPHFTYTYDFGDDWRHRITVEKTIPADEGVPYPVLVKGKRACPPEDCGGIWGYESFLEAYLDPEHPEHEQMREWAGDEFLPEEFSKDELEEINEYLREEFE